MKDLQYPIGKFERPGKFDEQLLLAYIEEIRILPKQLKAELAGIDPSLLDKRYRPDGWTIRQVVHHLSDSHINSYVRYRWTLTEENPTIKAYNEKLWSELHDGLTGPVEMSIDLLSALHHKWAYFLEGIDRDSYHRTFVHPESEKSYDLYTITALYAWHGKHHLGHIKLAKENPYE